MKRSNRLVILVGVLLAVLAFVGIVIVLQTGRGQNGGGTEKPTTVKVLVATQDIGLGDPITENNVATDEVAPEAVVGTRIADPSVVIGKTVLYPIASGAQISMDAFAGGVPGIEAQLQPGEKAIAFQVDRVTGLDFLLQAGDHIDIVLAQNVTPVQQTPDSIQQQIDNPDAPPLYEVVTGLNNVRTVKTIIQDRRVLYVSATRNRTTQTGTASPSPGAQTSQQTANIDSVIIVFAGSDQDAELIKFAQQDLSEVGSLSAVLRRAADTDEQVPPEDTSGITLKELIKTYGVLVPDIIVLQPEASATPAP